MGQGAERLKQQIPLKEISSLGQEVADLLDELYVGIYHIDYNVLRKVDWANDYYIRIAIRGGMATFDFDFLTRLVVYSHDRMLRVEVNPCNFNYLELLFHKRNTRDINKITECMPTMEQHLAMIRKWTDRFKNGDV